MIELIKDLPTHVVGFRASGKVNKSDYENVLIPAVDHLAKTFGKINFLLLLDTDVSNFTFGAWVDDALIGVKYFTKWHKIAIISDKDAIKKFTDIFGHLIPGESRGFKITDLDEAITWVATN